MKLRNIFFIIIVLGVATALDAQAGQSATGRSLESVDELSSKMAIDQLLTEARKRSSDLQRAIDKADDAFSAGSSSKEVKGSEVDLDGANSTSATGSLVSPSERLRRRFRGMSLEEAPQQSVLQQDADAVSSTVSLVTKNPIEMQDEVNIESMDKASDTFLSGLLSPEIQESKMDLDFTNSTLADVFMSIAEVSNINIMLDPHVRNVIIDVHLKQVALKEAMLLVADTHDLGYKRIENSISVSSKDKLEKQAVVSKVVRLKNIKAAEVSSLLTGLVPKINVGDETNDIVLIGRPSEILEAEKVVRTVDKARPQVVLEAKIIEVNKDALKELGIDWSDELSFSYQESGRPVTIPDTASAVDKVFQIGSFQRSAMSLTTLIKMLETKNKAKVLSNPRITTMNNKEAEIFVGDRIPYTVTTVSGGVATTDVRFEEPGIRLKITPSFIEGDFVVIKVEPEVSFIFSFSGPDNQYPWIKKRQATANVRVKNNEPFVLGGILSQEDKENIYKVPVLGNLPLLGNLFSYDSHTAQDTELIITITPRIVMPQPSE